MQVLTIAAVLAAAGAPALGPQERGPWTVVVEVDAKSICGNDCITAIANGLSSIGRVESKYNNKKNLFKVTIAGKKSVSLGEIKGSIPDGYPFRGATIEVSGMLSKSGDQFVLTSRSGQSFRIRGPRGIENGVGRSWTVSGRWSEGREGSVIEVSSYREDK